MEYIHLWLHYDGRYCTVLTRNVKSKIIDQIALCSSRRPSTRSGQVPAAMTA